MKRKSLLVLVAIALAGCKSEPDGASRDGSAVASSAQTQPGIRAQAGIRPARAGSGKAAAWIYLLDGQATVSAGNKFTFAGQPNTILLKTDRIAVDSPGFAVLKLANDYLIRLEGGMDVAMNNIALLDAPPSEESLIQQLDRLLSHAEKARGERIAGWHARMAGAQTVAPLAQRPVASEQAPPVAEEDGALTAKGEREEQARQKQPAQPVNKDDKNQRTKTKSTRPWQIRTGGKLATQSGPAPGLVARLESDSAFKACLRAALKPGKTELTVMLLMFDHQVQKLKLEGEQPAPDCALKFVAGQSMPDGPERGWVLFTIQFPAGDPAP